MDGIKKSLLAIAISTCFVTANADTLKQPVKGLVNMGDITFYNKQYLAKPPLPNNSLSNLYTNSTGANT